MKTSRSIPALIFLALLGLCACTAQKTAAGPSAFPFETSPPPEARSFAGNYLSARFALRRQDWNAAQAYYNGVVTHDAENASLREKAFLLSLGAGNYDKARDLAATMTGDEASAGIAQTFLVADALNRNDAPAALKLSESLSDDGFGAYTRPLLRAWSLAAAGREDEALALLDEGAKDDPTRQLHAGLIAEMKGRADDAALHYISSMANGLTIHSSVIVGGFFARAGKPEVGGKINASLAKLYPFNPFIAALQSRPYPTAGVPNAASPAEGAAIALYDLATLLYERKSYDSAQIYVGLSRMLKPDSPFAAVLAGDLAALREQHAEAVALYNGVPQDSPLYWLARMRVAEVYEVNGRVDLAAGLLDDLSSSAETKVNALVALGDLRRRHDDYPRAVAAYDAALKAIGETTPAQWQVVYARGMALDRMNNWELAEKDLLQALAWQPENAQILNYLGYSWIERGLNREQAFAYIRKAVDLRPDDGYILDSYGWAHYKTGNYAEAVKWLERAVSLVPEDATMLEHLGDAYWQAGRKTEAVFKWKRAIETNGDAAARKTLESKVLTGLPSRHGDKEARL